MTGLVFTLNCARLKQDLLAEAAPAGSVLDDAFEPKAAAAVSGNFHEQFAKIALAGFLALTVVGIGLRISYCFILRVAQTFEQALSRPLIAKAPCEQHKPH